MSWTDDKQARMNHLRNQDLAGLLTEADQAELGALMAEVEAEESQVLTPALQRLRTEVGELEREIATVQTQNQESARLLARQQALAEDGRRFLAEFERRRTSILDGLARLTRRLVPIT